MYEYSARIISVYDGDTFTFQVDLGFSIQVTERLRLARVNTPELKGDEKIEGKKVRDIVRELILNKDVILKVHKKGKYGRYIADVEFDLDGKQTNLSDYLVTHNYAETVTY